MPSNELHDWLAETTLNIKDKEKIKKVNRLVDFGWHFHGKEHRKIWGHDPLSLLMIYKIFKDDPEALKIAVLHVLTDFSVNKKKEKYLRFLKALIELKK